MYPNFKNHVFGHCVIFFFQAKRSPPPPPPGQSDGAGTPMKAMQELARQELASQEYNEEIYLHFSIYAPRITYIQENLKTIKSFHFKNLFMYDLRTTTMKTFF